MIRKLAGGDAVFSLMGPKMALKRREARQASNDDAIAARRWAREAGVRARGQR